MRNILITMLLGMLAACATVPAKPAFNKQQVATMTELGFEPVGENYELDFNDRVLFEVDKSDLHPEAAASLGKISQTLLTVGIKGAAVIGHTDATGADDYNLGLSQRRAASVKAALVATGMDPARTRDEGRGETQPIASNDTEDGRAQNRRVVIIVAPEDTQ
ncbi:MAG: OmpA family protein [Sphingomonadaceae bacterium]|nr:OmpA family protein [Sphingomonadaceae bacterium]